MKKKTNKIIKNYRYRLNLYFLNKQMVSLSIAIMVLLMSLITLIIASKDYKKHAIVYYRTYSEKSGWTSWVRNGEISGRKNEKITGIQIKVKTKINGNVFYDVYSDGKWSNKNISNGKTLKTKKDGIQGIRASLTDNLRYEYEIYYRIHNKKNGWMAWSYDYITAGNSKYDIDQIQIKIVKQYEDFDRELRYNNSSKLNFDE